MSRRVSLSQSQSVGAVACCALLAIAWPAVGRSSSEVSASSAAEQGERTRWSQPARAVSDFTLTDQEGTPQKFSSLRGRTALVFFGFSNCPNVCPPTLQKLRQVQRALQKSGALSTVFVSVDGERDTPAVMKAYLEPFQPGFIGLTGDPRDVRAIAAQFSAVFFKGPAIDAKGGYNVEHTSQVYLVDRDGRIRAVFFNAPAEEMTAAARKVMAETVPAS